MFSQRKEVELKEFHFKFIHIIFLNSVAFSKYLVSCVSVIIICILSTKYE